MSEMKIDYCIKKYRTCIDQIEDEVESIEDLDEEQDLERELYVVFLKELKQIKEEIISLTINEQRQKQGHLDERYKFMDEKRKELGLDT
jgi:vacuolar-type H+-ATPase subunit I/STV1